MKSKVALLLTLFFVLFVAIPNAQAATAAPAAAIKLYLNGQELTSTIPPRVIKQTTMVPIRIISEGLGAPVSWDKAEQTVNITQQQTVLVLDISNSQAYVNGQAEKLDQPPTVEKGTTLLPIRFVSERLGVTVIWDAPTNSVHLWKDDLNVPGSDPAVNPDGEVTPEIPSTYPALQSIKLVNNQLLIQANGSLTPNVFTLANPDRLVIDLPGLQFGDLISNPLPGTTGVLVDLPADNPSVANIRYAMSIPETSTIRIVADLKQPINHQLVPTGDTSNLTINLEPYTTVTPGNAAVLIYHSHNQESWLPELPGVTNPNLAYSPTKNITTVGERLAMNLQGMGMEAFHSAEDYQKSYGKNYKSSQSYIYSEKTVRDHMTSHPQIKYLIDIHRDSSSRGSTTLNINGVSYAKLYFVIGLENPNWKQNDAFAKQIQSMMNERYPGISRGIYYKDRKSGNGWYNQQLSPTSALIEVGGVENTITESNRTIDILADVINQIRIGNQLSSEIK
ncbi:stage II sporulation protein P [Paenibacillus mendelii]|uniref:Stage II sporulation protein P n=1 Tax=Paenibacillus mendelii TaxID=206163 RepID=A0ABV6J2P7_9BACL|nr:stage II sporulation protein P [Paenibacillus mendelii]MCQ6559259.1 stage II sporulation protein P [Paenibacillus mendelii]